MFVFHQFDLIGISIYLLKQKGPITFLFVINYIKHKFNKYSKFNTIILFLQKSNFTISTSYLFNL